MRRLTSAVALAACAFGVAMGCGSDDDGNDNGNGAGSGGSFGLTGGATGSGATGSGASGNNGSGGRTGGSDSCQPSPDDEGCVGEQYAGETVPVDVYIMFDQSCSMSCPVSRSGPGQCCMGGPDPRITPVREAVRQFLRDPASAGLGVGIGYFGYMPSGRTSCDPEDYSEASVGIGTLPGHADALLESLDSVEPTGETPTGAAIRGACEYTSQWKNENPGRSTVILLVTDGVPETPSTRECREETNIEDAESAAEECLSGDSRTKTYVLGVGQALENLNRIAEAGGTNSAYLVSGGDVTQSVLEALNAIRADAVIPCELNIPQPGGGEQLDFTRVNLGICDAGGTNRVTYKVSGPSGCGSEGGWYYDTDESGGAVPTRIMLCEASCETVSVPGAQLFYTVGCGTQTDGPE